MVLKPAFFEFRRSKEINGACFTCFNVVILFLFGEEVQLVDDFSGFLVSSDVLDLCTGNEQMNLGKKRRQYRQLKVLPPPKKLICLYHNPREFYVSHSPIFLHVQFGCRVKFQFLAQFPVGYISHPVFGLLTMVMVCDIVVSEFELESYHNTHFQKKYSRRKDRIPLISSSKS